MNWRQLSHGVRLDSIDQGSPEALVVLLPDLGDSAATLAPIAARWATSAPTTSFIALDGIEQLNLEVHRRLDLDADAGPAPLDRAAQRLEQLLDQHLWAYGFNADQLVLVGFGHGGTLALHLSLHQGWGCAGILAFAAKLTRPLPRAVRRDLKIRLIKCLGYGDVDHSSLHDVVASLTARGIDTRGVLLGGSTHSDEAVRHGGAYLVELIANAQKGNRFQVNRENSHAQ